MPLRIFNGLEIFSQGCAPTSSVRCRSCG